MQRPGFSFLVCPDPEGIKDLLEDLLRHFPGFSPRIFWGDEELSEKFWQALTVPTMMGPPSAVVLRKAQETPDSLWTAMNSMLAMARQSIWPVFCLEGEWNKGRPAVPKAVSKGKFWPVAQKNRWIVEYPGLTRKTLGAEIERFAQTNKLDISPQIRQHLVQKLPLSTIALRQELEKILLLTGNSSRVTAEHLKALTTEDSFDIFAFLNDLQNPAALQKIWTRLISDPAMVSGDMLFPLSALLLREARQLWYLAHNEDNRVSLPPFLKTKKKSLAQSLGAQRIGRFWDLVLEADTAVKTGRLRPPQALENLIQGMQDLG